MSNRKPYHLNESEISIICKTAAIHNSDCVYLCIYFYNCNESKCSRIEVRTAKSTRAEREIRETVRAYLEYLVEWNTIISVFTANNSHFIEDESVFVEAVIAIAAALRILS